MASSSSEDNDQVIEVSIEEDAATYDAQAHGHLPPEGRFIPVPREIREYALKMECSVVQINAQRFFGPPTSVDINWSPEKGSEIFVGRLPRDILEPELVPWLEQIGPIFQLRLMMDFSGTNKGFCFVKYFTQEQANLAVEALHHKDLNGHVVVVAKSVDNKRLALSGVSTDKTEDDIRQVVEPMSDGVVDVEITWRVDGYHPNPRGVAFVTYQSHREAAIARKKMLQKPMFMGDQRVFADWAEGGPGSGAPFRRQSKSHNILVVHGLARGTRLQTMWETFKALGPYCGVDYIQMNKRKDKAFVYFKKRAQAEVAKVAFDGSEIDGCQVRVGWCAPESAPKKPPKKQTNPPFYLPPPQPCMDPAHLWSGGAGGGEMFGYEAYQQQQQMWYPQQMVPQMMTMSSSGPMSYVSSGGEGASSSQDPSQVYYPPCQPYQGWAPPSTMQDELENYTPSGTVYYYPVTVATELGYQQGYQAHVEEASWERQGRGAGYHPSPSSSYPGVYWTHYTPYDYYQENKVICQNGHGQDGVESDDKEDEEPVVREEQVEEDGREEEEQGPRPDLYCHSIWM